MIIIGEKQEVSLMGGLTDLQILILDCVKHVEGYHNIGSVVKMVRDYYLQKRNTVSKVGKHLLRVEGYVPCVGTVYYQLGRLEAKGFISLNKDGGEKQSRVYARVTRKGLEALEGLNIERDVFFRW